ATFATNPGALPTAPVPYPPLFAWLLTPLAALYPPLGFAVWTALSLAALGGISREIASCLPWWKSSWGIFVLLLFPGVMATLILGQVMIYLAGAMAECYLCLRAGRDFRAGLWLATFCLKPHYAVILGLVLLWKRRWVAIIGAAVGT